MVTTNRIPRVRILESDFPVKIPRDIENSFLEVVNQNGETIALFFLYNSLHKIDFQDGLEFAKYYDDIDANGFEKEDWEELKEICEVSDDAEIPDNYIGSYDKRNWFSESFVCYGRLKFPYGLEKSARKDYDERFFWGGLISDALEEAVSVYQSDWVDILIFFFDFYKVKESPVGFRNNFGEYKEIELFINMIDNEIIAQIADNLFSKDNIDLFIEAANDVNKSETLSFLLDYKNKHFK